MTAHPEGPDLSQLPTWTKRSRILTLLATLVAGCGLTVLVAPAADAQTKFLGAGSQLDPCQSISSPNADYQLTMQCDGNLVLTAQPSNHLVWASGTNFTGSVLQVQADGNAVVYSPGHVARWETGTAQYAGAVLALQDDGNLVVVAPGNRPVWATDSVGAGQYVDSPMPGNPAPTRFVALGDSYSAGEGLAPYEDGTATQSDSCHRSQAKAYALLVDPKPDVFAACSMQTIDAYYNPYQSELAQRSHLGADTKLVTLTFGGNDLDWTGTLQACSKIQLQVTHTTVRGTPEACQAALDSTQGRIDDFKRKLLGLYRDVLHDAPHAQVRVLTYPPLFPLDRSDNGGCRIVRFGPAQVVIAADVEHQFGLYEEQANLAILDAVNQVALDSPGRIRSVDVESQFGGYMADGHTISCGDTGRPTPWINSVKFSTSDAALLAADAYDGNWDQVAVDLFKVYSASFHPTEEGQRQMALALKATL